MKLLVLQAELMSEQLQANRQLIEDKKVSRDNLVQKENGVRREVQGEIDDLIAKNENILSILQFGEIVVPNAESDVVEIGSLVSLLFDDGEEEDIFLIEDNYASALTSSDVPFMSITSPLGAAVFGKKRGDTASYIVDSEGRKIKVFCEIIGVNNKIEMNKGYVRK